MGVAMLNGKVYDSSTVNGDRIKEIDVESKPTTFNKSELQAIASALVIQQKSVMRLAAKEGQPDSVAAEYRKVAKTIDELLKKVTLAV